MPAVKSAERSRILATLAERPGLTAYEVARVLGYGKPQSNQVAQLVARMHQAGELAVTEQFRPLLGRPARVYRLAPPGTPRQPREETPQQQQDRRERNRIARARQRARSTGRLPAQLLPAPPPGWELRGGEPACASVGGDALWFGPQHEAPRVRAARVQRAVTICAQCPVRLACLDGALARGERFGVWGGIDFERHPQTTRPAVHAAGQA